MSSGSYPERLYRYTDVLSLFHIIKTKSLTLLDPSLWDDKNDTHSLLKYREVKDFNTLCALCFTGSGETYHHWSVFAGGRSGVRICFDKDSLLAYVNKHDNVFYGNVKYYRLLDYKKDKVSLDNIPFAKRLQYEDEREFRIFYSCKCKRIIKYYTIDINLNTISSIMFSPWINGSVFDSVKGIILDSPNCSHIQISRSRITGSSRWQKATERIVSGV